MDPVSLSSYWDMLDRHDWLFEFSDDHSVYTRGRGELAKLHVISKQSPEHGRLFHSFQDHHFNGPAWKTNQPPKPERPKTPVQEKPNHG